jgi:ABC-type transporter Mla subunit MlaD
LTRRSAVETLAEASSQAQAIHADVERHHAALQQAADEGRAAIDQLPRLGGALEERFDEIEQEASAARSARERTRAALERSGPPATARQP